MFEDKEKVSKEVYYDEENNVLRTVFNIDVGGMSRERVEEIIADFKLTFKDIKDGASSTNN